MMKTISLYVKGPAKGLKKLERLYENGELSKLIGHEVLDIQKCSKKQIESLYQKGLISPVNTTKTTTHWIKNFWHKTISAPILSAGDFVMTSRLSQAVIGSLFVLVIASILVIPQIGQSPMNDHLTPKQQPSTSTTSALISQDIKSVQQAQECYAVFQKSQIQITSGPIQTQRFFVFVIEYQPTQYNELVQTFKQCEITPSRSVLENSKIKLQFFIKEPYE